MFDPRYLNTSAVSFMCILFQKFARAAPSIRNPFALNSRIADKRVLMPDCKQVTFCDTKPQCRRQIGAST